MKVLKLFIIPLSVLFIGCNEFSKTEEAVIESGRLHNEAIASEFYDTFVDYWNNTINVKIEKTMKTFGDEAIENISNSYMFLGDNLLSDMYVSEQEKKVKALDNMADSFRDLFQNMIDLLKFQIGTSGLVSTSNALDVVLENIEKGSNKWIYDENEESFSFKLGMIIVHPKYGFVPDNVNQCNNCDFNNMPWQLYYKNDANVGVANNCVYAVLKLVQKWLNNKQERNVSVVYCVPYEDSFNSYLIGYSNHRSFLITFFRNDEEKCSYEWQEMEYESSYVGNSLLD